jgi:hypothetical protein
MKITHYDRTGLQQFKKASEVMNYKVWEIKIFNIFAIAKGIKKLSYGVTGNTSDFGSEEFRFEP